MSRKCTIIVFSVLIISALTFHPVLAQKSLRIVFSGDIMCHDAQIRSAYDSERNDYSFDDYFTSLRALFNQADLVAGNLETTLSNENYSGYPSFASPDQLLLSLKKAGFDLLFTSNNHSLDKGVFGLERTLSVLDHSGMYHTGTFRSQEERDLINPLIINSKGMKIAFLNYSYGSNAPINNRQKFVLNVIDTIAISNDIAIARQRMVDLIICYVHWGSEYQAEPDNQQKMMAAFFKKKGISIVIGSHPHVVQPVTIEKEKSQIQFVCAYSLGNLISNQRSGKKKEGLLVEIVLKKNTDQLVISAVNQYPTFVERLGEKGKYDYQITLPALPAPTSQTAGL